MTTTLLRAGKRRGSAMTESRVSMAANELMRASGLSDAERSPRFQPSVDQ